ncbi:PIN domain-containing protein [Conexibacter arvalis]|uniref:PIN domain nuclease of toxin-antitoxin system n=1 Tax=Conexibacter arvalis TaxID=912552 RepID=A0A840IJH4_9ACTN|nr:PIN domain nuclease of toxin-antitoxin system [Conexibacter arvalis]
MWLWWASTPERLSPAAAEAISSAVDLAVSTLSCWEVAMLAERGRIALDRPAAQWVRAALAADDRLRALAPDADVAVRAAQLGRDGFHGDPADRFIYATARARAGTLVTRDEALRRFDPERTVW